MPELSAIQRSEQLGQGQLGPTAGTTYDPPQVETVMTAADLEREALYAGFDPYGPI